MKSRSRRTLLLIPLLLLVIGGKCWLDVVNAPVPTGYLCAPPPGEYARPKWDDLRAGKWTYRHRPTVVKSVAELDGKPVRIDGYLLPLHVAGLSSQFFISQRPRGCYFCNPPGIAEVVQVNIKDKRLMDITDDYVHVFGRLKIATGAPTDQTLYAVDDAVMGVSR